VTVALKLATEPAFTVNADGCEVRLGGEFTVTVNVPLAVFPTLSVAVAVTVVVPMANVPPLTGEYVMVGVPMLSVALAPVSVTTALVPEVAITLVPLTVKTGAIVSTVPVIDRVPAPEDAGRFRASRKPLSLYRLIGSLCGPLGWG